MYAAPYVVLEHQFPYGIALVNRSVARLGLSMASAREGSIECIVSREAMVVAYPPCQGVGTGLRELRVDDVARFVHPRVIQLERHAPVKEMGHADIHAPYSHAIFVPVERTWHALTFSAIDGGDALVEDIAIAHDREVVASVENSSVTDAVGALDMSKCMNISLSVGARKPLA